MEILRLADERRALLAGRPSRRPLLRQWEESRQARALVLLLAPHHPPHLSSLLNAVAAELTAMPSRPVDRVELIVRAPALTPEVASRLLSLVREFAREVSLVLLDDAGRGETLLAVGADAVTLRPEAALSTLLAPASAEVEGLRALVAAQAVQGPEAVAALLAAGAPPASLGAALSTLERTSRLASMVAASRIHSPDPGELAELIETLTRWIARDGDFLTRRQARQLRGLALQIPVHAIEVSLAELAERYRPVADGALHSLVESVEQLRFAAGSGDEGWELAPDEDLQ